VAPSVRASGTLKLIVFLACAVGLTIGLISYGQAHRQVVYHGRSLTEWQAALFDTSAGVRDTAAYALTRLAPADPRTLAGVVRAEAVMLADEDSDVRSDATSALVALHRRSDLVTPTVATVLDQSPNPDARVQAIQVLAAIGPDAAEAASAVVRALDDSNAAVRLVAVAALGRVGLGTAPFDVVVNASTDANPDVRAAAIETLVTLHASRDILLTVAERAVSDPDTGVRTQAIYALAATGALDAVPTLERAANDSDREVRRSAREALVSVRSRHR
jgi:HEAT repeat protein